MQKSSHLGPSAGLALGHRDQATRDSGHQGSCDEGCLHAEGFVQLLGSHAAEAEEEDARRKEHGLAQAGGPRVLWDLGGQTYLALWILWIEQLQASQILAHPGSDLSPPRPSRTSHLPHHHGRTNRAGCQRPSSSRWNGWCKWAGSGIFG